LFNHFHFYFWIRHYCATLRVIQIVLDDFGQIISVARHQQIILEFYGVRSIEKSDREGLSHVPSRQSDGGHLFRPLRERVAISTGREFCFPDRQEPRQSSAPASGSKASEWLVETLNSFFICSGFARLVNLPHIIFDYTNALLFSYRPTAND